MDLENTFEKGYDMLVEYGIATEDEIALVTAITGNSIQALESILFVRTGYRDFEQFAEYETQ